MVLDLETSAMRDASYEAMNKHGRRKNSNTSTVTNSKGNKLKDTILGSTSGLLSGTIFSICENFGDDIIVGNMRTKLYGISTKIPVTLGVFDDAFKQLGVVGLGLSIYDNRNYGLVRSGIDILGFAGSALATTAVAASGGWVVVGVGLGIGVLTEIFKWGATEIIRKFD